MLVDEAQGGGGRDSATSTDDIVKSGRYFIHASYAEGFDALSQDADGENYIPKFVPLRGKTGGDSSGSHQAVLIGNDRNSAGGDHEPITLPNHFADELIPLEDFDQVLFFVFFQLCFRCHNSERELSATTTDACNFVGLIAVFRLFAICLSGYFW